MSSQPKNAFLVLVDDFTDADALQRRLAVRTAHLAGATKCRERGALVLGGAMLDSHESGKMVGSALIVNAASRDEVLEMLKSDPYTEGRAWDMDTVRIYPFREASF
ncbi:hypothetical protein IWQ56_001410 [Coemansia nantahalensis]|uniref:Uncharacterized protein n=2 Tax=Coemansia TaxID=4863 RepID=A0ACC1K7A1_9FUNG|nr:hypothetical protein IWQ56_001410 [Coemansia nantahalensis]KAJ2774907.1 hypothetical protein IWQ57_000617 [Coemansia nantahalensis]